MALLRNEFEDRPALAEALADAIVKALVDGITRKGRAAVAFSGGSTPKMLFATLATRTDLDWSKVDITLVDERWVDEGSDRSNARLLRDNLLTGPAAAARFVPLYAGGDAPDDANLAAANKALLTMALPFDVVVLGMGNDGHTASFFPGGDTLSDALTSSGPLIALNAEGADEPRVTWTLPNLVAAGALFLHIEGDEKRATLERALGQGPVEDMPVRAVLRNPGTTVNLYWSA